MLVARRGGAYTATRLDDGRVLVAGGNNADGPVADAELFDPSSGTWTVTGSMVVPRCWMTVESW